MTPAQAWIVLSLHPNLSDQTKIYSRIATEQPYTFSAAVNQSSSASLSEKQWKHIWITFRIKSLLSILLSNKLGIRPKESSNPATTFTH